MLSDIKTIREYHPNGALFFETDYAEIVDFPELYTGHVQLRELRDSKPVTPYIILRQEKHYDNGQLAWSLKWDNSGILINRSGPTYRKDGSVITYK